MDADRFLSCLAADATRLRTVAAGDLPLAVPSCPAWSVADLVRHTARVYLHKVECMRNGAPEGPWPPAGTEDEDPLALFDRAYVDLVGELTSRAPEDATPTWYGPDQTVGFWIRRMAQETVIHRVDAELAKGEVIAPIPDDLAIDGIDEVLVCFLAYQFSNWVEEFAEPLASTDGRGVTVRAGGSAWAVRATVAGVTVERGDGDSGAVIGGAPADVLLWLWRRTDDAVVSVDGDAALAAELRGLLEVATQ